MFLFSFLITGPDKLSCDMEELLLRGDYSDLTIRVQNREFKAHKAVVGVRSPVFASKFKAQMFENDNSPIEIVDCDAVAFREFLRYLYASRVEENTPEVLFPLYQASDKYQMIDLKVHCLEQIRSTMSLENFCNSAVLCFKYNEERFKDIVSQFLAENMTDILKMEEWKNFESENPVEAEELSYKALIYQEQMAISKQNFLQKICKQIRGRK